MMVDSSEKLNSKENVLFETIKGVCFGAVGAIAVGTIISCYNRSAAFRTFRLPAFDEVSKMVLGYPGVIAMSILGSDAFLDARRNNRELLRPSSLARETRTDCCRRNSNQRV
jgi:hypothetical protein